MESFTLEAGVFEEPASVDFVAAVFGFPEGDVWILGWSVENDVFEEAAGGSFGGWIGEFGFADFCDGVSDGFGVVIFNMVGVEIGLERVVKWFFDLFFGETESDGDDEIAAFGLARVENGVAVGKVAILGGEFFEFVDEGVVNFDAYDGVFGFLAVGADVLDGGSSQAAGNFGHGFDAGEAFFADEGDKIVPDDAAVDFDFEFGGGFLENVETHDFVNDDGAGEAFVFSERVGAGAEKIKGEAFFFDKFEGIGEFCLVFDFYDEIGGAAKAHGGKGGEVDVFSDVHEIYYNIFCGKMEA